MRKVSTAQWDKMSGGEKLQYLSERIVPGPIFRNGVVGEPTKQSHKLTFTFTVEIQVKAHTQEEAREKISKVGRNNYLLVNNLQVK